MNTIFSFIINVLGQSWDLFLEAAPYILFGLIVGGLLKVFLSPTYVARHLGQGRFTSVLKAALLGIPIPLCSCGVLPAAATLKKQGANNGATTAFLISTPESGVDSISITYALLDPIMTVARPVAAFISAFVAGFTENFIHPPSPAKPGIPHFDDTSPSCCDNDNPQQKHGFGHKLLSSINYAAKDIWGDLAGWFYLGIILAGLITVIIPDELFTTYLGGGFSSMILMLGFGIPLYICATASTPIAAALILKGVSPGAALVFLLVGPATNITSLSVLIGLLGKRATAIYLISISVIAVISGLILDTVYGAFGISAKAVAGQAAEILPHWFVLSSGIVLLGLSIQPLYRTIRSWFITTGDDCGCSPGSCTPHNHADEDDCGCTDDSDDPPLVRIQPQTPKEDDEK